MVKTSHNSGAILSDFLNFYILYSFICTIHRYITQIMHLSKKYRKTHLNSCNFTGGNALITIISLVRVACTYNEAAIAKVMEDMDSSKKSSIYPGELHCAMQNRYNVVANKQCYLHETFMTICSDGDKKDINDAVASHFHIGSQFRKTCKECASFEVGTPETHTTLIAPLLNGINDLEKAVETNMNQDITVRCAKCGKDTTHTRVQNFLFLPETLALCFTRFEVNNRTTRKNSAMVQLPIELKNLGNMLCHYEFRSSALHHGTQIENGHYNAFIVDDYEVFLVDDEVICDVTDDWLYRVQRTVYLAFYTKKSPSYSLTEPMDN